MRHFIVIFTLFLSQCQSFPLPAGQIIKYRVSSKYFNRQNDTSDNSLYQLLSQIHYGTKEPSTVVASEQVTTIANELPLEQHKDAATTVINDITNEYPEVIFSFLNYTAMLNG